ncbi:ribulose-phosphate 3-epimerase [Gregarina niphandrodes]|uniref:Ribulose-phosphate 3-epimerase n=1 Tax=Gregarina niphandrodes TaxID=110365 RepID=A0A023B362_GRENI|nr:ribulose-phosphate 3-epimerase [Gregarina niphandrodes]EZG55101.1 ribulose-phosphate 3-epimerase [Gregarina niphandrodes]|eukprot:XP_011131778.1 ribulose-phosphate 3-epimerase [Gregarina niphandrodes]
MDPIIAPSILNSDFAKLKTEIETVVPQVQWLHIDIMDGDFVPNISIGPCVAQAIRKSFNDVKLDCHLMTSEPSKWLKPLLGACNLFTFHYEAVGEDVGVAMDLCRSIRALGMKSSISIKPKTPLEKIYPLLDQDLLDGVLIMTVEPGFGGQSFMPEMLEKVKRLHQKYPNVTIEVDGGINPKTIRSCYDAGARMFVAGSAIFKHPDRTSAIENLLKPLRHEN